MLNLANGANIPLKSNTRIIFEVQDLKVASPALVSRCGMIHID
jgi:dynein heavy chain